MQATSKLASESGNCAASHEAELPKAVLPTGDPQHRLGRVDANDRGAVLGESQGRLAGPRRDVEHSAASADLRQSRDLASQPPDSVYGQVVERCELRVDPRAERVVLALLVRRAVLLVRLHSAGRSMRRAKSATGRLLGSCLSTSHATVRPHQSPVATLALRAA